MGKTTIIISELTREQTLTVPQTIKTQIKQFGIESSLDNDIIEHWTELPGLSRLVVVLKTPEVASTVFEHLKKLNPNLKIHLSESIFPRHKSVDGSLNITIPLSPEPEKYQEPKPVHLEETNNKKKSYKKVLLESLSLDTGDSTKKAAEGTISPVSPIITLEQVDQ